MTIVYQTILIGNTYSRAVNAPGAELFLALNLPPGLSMSTNGVISGLPTQVGRHAVSILARGPSGTGVAVLDLTVSPQQIPVITSATIINQEALTPLSYQITAVTPPPSSLPILSFGATNLPTGLTVNTSTGLITGTPSVASEAPTFTVVSTISATNANGTGQTFLTFNFTQRPVITSSLAPLTFTGGVAITPYTITASKSPISFAATPLPSGLSFNSVTGVISGTPTNPASPVTTPISLTATNSILTSVAQILNVTVTPAVTTYTYSDGSTSTTYDTVLTSGSRDPIKSVVGVSISPFVTSIWTSAFENCFGLTSITIPSSVTTIGSKAFKFSGLTGITIPNSMSSIGNEAFFGCSSLLSVSIGSGVISIGYGAFGNCFSLTSVVIPDNVTSIGQQAFVNCGLNTATIGNGLTTIPQEAFLGSQLVSGVTIGTGVTLIGQSAFANCLLPSISIPNNVITISNSAFISNPNLATVTLGTGVTSIGSYAFALCDALTTLAIGSGVLTLGDGLVGASSGLTSINVDAANPNYSSISGVLFNKLQTQLRSYPAGKVATSYTIPATVTDIRPSAFAQAVNLTSISLPANPITIGDFAFQSCTGLTGTFTIPNSVTSIGDYALAGCNNITGVTIGSSVSTIGHEAFTNLGISTITIPSSVTSVGFAFVYGCASLTSINFLGNAPTISGGSVISDFGTVYYCSNKTGFTNPFGGRPAVSGPAC